MVENQTTSSNSDQCSKEDVLTTTLTIINNLDRQTWKSINPYNVSSPTISFCFALSNFCIFFYNLHTLKSMKFETHRFTCLLCTEKRYMQQNTIWFYAIIYWVINFLIIIKLVKKNNKILIYLIEWAFLKDAILNTVPKRWLLLIKRKKLLEQMIYASENGERFLENLLCVIQ